VLGTVQALVTRRYTYVGRHRLEVLEESGPAGGGAADLPTGNSRLRLWRRAGVLQKEQGDVVLELTPGDPLDERALQ
jgi:hypothetical protein